MTKDGEERIERRIHWIQIVAGGIIAATVWCAKIQFELVGIEKDMELQKSNRDQMISRIWDKIGTDHDMLIRHDEKLKGVGGNG